MKTVQFVFALHDHQPVGNFDGVFADAYEKAYLPFLDLLEIYKGFRAVLHHTGPLLEWIEENRPDYLKRLARLVASGQVELLGGAFYEPILPVIPEADQVGQILKMSDWLEKRFGTRPRGMWLAERVWEPTLPTAMAKAGIEYTVLDDSHFASVGVRPEQALGYFLTEDQGNAVAVFPINEAVRHRIPYAQPDETIHYLREMSDAQAARTVVMADDGEKFGVWPDSHWYCYQDGWMYRFVEKVVNNRDWIQMKTFSEVLDTTEPLGRVYLPTASYSEMMQWAMPPEASNELDEIKNDLKERGAYDRAHTYVRGGFWRSFLTKYDESNHLHKRMLHVSGKIAALEAEGQGGAKLDAARDHLWRAQCNCAYWHGVFGGIYLTNLRNALYRHLIAADTLADEVAHGTRPRVSYLAKDFDVDGAPELLVETPDQAMMFKPQQGGILVEHDIRAANVNLLDTLGRRREAYHKKLEESGSDARVKEKDLGKYLAVDWYRRGALIDHFMGRETTPEMFRTAAYPELGEFVTGPFELEWETVEDSAVIRMKREGFVTLAVGAIPVLLEKTIFIPASGCANRVEYRVTNKWDVELEARFGVEFNANLLAGNAPDRYHEVEGANLGGENSLDSLGIVKNTRRFALVDEWMKLRVQWELSTPAEHWRLPIETVSDSEYGIERVYQSTVVMPVWKLKLAPGRSFEAVIDYGVTQLD
ncbi:MAG: 4-alpha-glucanotransferase [Candidatus Sumerlaeota bacterium]|nr:4-alpha-glucanotransferase [Candidatus Sumerlaeota bacterium]